MLRESYFIENGDYVIERDSFFPNKNEEFVESEMLGAKLILEEKFTTDLVYLKNLSGVLNLIKNAKNYESYRDRPEIKRVEKEVIKNLNIIDVKSNGFMFVLFSNLELNKESFVRIVKDVGEKELSDVRFQSLISRNVSKFEKELTKEQFMALSKSFREATEVEKRTFDKIKFLNTISDTLKDVDNKDKILRDMRNEFYLKIEKKIEIFIRDLKDGKEFKNSKYYDYMDLISIYNEIPSNEFKKKPNIEMHALRIHSDMIEDVFFNGNEMPLYQYQLTLIPNSQLLSDNDTSKCLRMITHELIRIGNSVIQSSESKSKRTYSKSLMQMLFPENTETQVSQKSNFDNTLDEFEFTLLNILANIDFFEVLKQKIKLNFPVVKKEDFEFIYKDIDSIELLFENEYYFQATSQMCSLTEMILRYHLSSLKFSPEEYKSLDYTGTYTMGNILPELNSKNKYLLQEDYELLNYVLLKGDRDLRGSGKNLRNNTAHKTTARSYGTKTDFLLASSMLILYLNTIELSMKNGFMDTSSLTELEKKDVHLHLDVKRTVSVS
jgi:hypothetical protein